MIQPSFNLRDRAESTTQGMAETLLSQSIMASIPDAIVAVTQQGVIVQVNAQTEALFGYTRDELIGQRVEILVPERLGPQHHLHRQNFHRQPKIRRMGSGLDLRGRRRDGTEFPVEISLSPIAVDDGTIVLSVIRDNSDRKRIEEELRRANEELDRRKSRELREYQNRLALIVDSSQDAIIGKNLDGIVTHWNKGAEEMYGYTAPEMIGRPISTLAPQERADEIPPILQKIRNGERVEYFESLRVTKDKRKLNVSISVSPIYDAEGKVVGGIDHCAQHHRAKEGRRPATAIAEDGGPGPVGRWRSARFQQSSRDRNGMLGVASQPCGPEQRGVYRQDPGGHQTRRVFNQATAGLQPQTAGADAGA